VDARKQAVLVVPLVIATLIGVFTLVALLAETAIGMPKRLQMPPAARIAGLGVLAVGFAFMGWIVRYRRPVEILMSTFESMRKARRTSAAQRTPPRAERLVVDGPHRYVRHPMYFAVVVLLIGWWLLLDYTVLLIVSLLFLLWFRFVVIRFEERELLAVFGIEYESYVKAVPMLVPSLRPRWP
jgi:protein-S-isoprenylcysteine O-methyltransferase Ste14